MTIPWPPAAQTAHNPQAVARILKTLPEWFGREESNAEYIHDAERLETWTVTHPETHEIVVSCLSSSTTRLRQKFICWQ